MSINNVTISGNLTRDPELRTAQSGTEVLSLGVAVNDRVKRGDNWEDYPNFIDCKMFGKRASSLSQYLSKGTKVAIQGKLHYSTWQDKSGNKRAKLEVIIDDIELMAKAAKQEPKDAYADEDIPF